MTASTGRGRRSPRKLGTTEAMETPDAMAATFVPGKPPARAPESPEERGELALHDYSVKLADPEAPLVDVRAGRFDVDEEGRLMFIDATQSVAIFEKGTWALGQQTPFLKKRRARSERTAPFLCPVPAV